MEQIIHKTRDLNIFLSYWVDEYLETIPFSQLTIDFNPPLEYLNVGLGLCLVHWQEKTRFLKRFNLWCDGEFFSLDYPVFSEVSYTVVHLEKPLYAYFLDSVMVYRRSFFDPIENSILSLPLTHSRITYKLQNRF